ncbi:MAG: acetoacetate--CoA ligase [Rudaea sp.]|uniref:acetoacetate--CoA ligase n=1 Tax=Rudaea sp. TaxID=2136325 RepID=UPI0039E39C7D
MPQTRATSANTIELRDWIHRRDGTLLDDYAALHAWSVEDISRFWRTLWDYFDLRSPSVPDRAITTTAMPGAKWFEGVQVNYAAQVLRHVAANSAPGAPPAIVFRNEALQREGRTLEIAWPELAARTAAVAASLRSLGVNTGDRVAAYLPNTPEAVIAFLACASIGAIWSVCAPDMGAATVLDRFRQIAPKVLIGCDGSVYGGKVNDRRALIAQLLKELPSIESAVIVPNLADSGAPAAPFDAGEWKGRVLGWHECVESRGAAAPTALPFDHPLWILYSSGTTGLPKPIVHGHGGVILEMLKLHRFHLDLGPTAETGDRLLWYSSSGWVMWNLQMSALLLGTTVCIYDGHPSYPEADTLWRVADGLGATLLGAGAAYYTSCMKNGVDPRAACDTTRLRALGSTGSPLPPEAYVWGREKVKADLWWAVIAGGTDIASAFFGGTPELPTVPGEMQARCLGVDAQAWNEQGKPVIGEVGELVCVQPLPSMPLKFWGDEENKRYLASYFDVYPGVWRHGDWVEITACGSAIIYGRSDATLNRHGHRMGTSELYRVVEAVPEVLDSLIVDIEYLGKPSFMPLFVVLREGNTLDDALRERLKREIRDKLSPRFVPDEIVQLADIPRTLTGKKQELPVKKLMLGKALAEVVNKDACANPAAFDPIVAFARERLGAA